MKINACQPAFTGRTYLSEKEFNHILRNNLTLPLNKKVPGLDLTFGEKCKVVLGKIKNFFK